LIGVVAAGLWFGALKRAPRWQKKSGKAEHAQVALRPYPPLPRAELAYCRGAHQERDVQLACCRDGEDDDRDGIPDLCEELLAERFAPIVYHSTDETNFPISVDNFLAETTLGFFDEACSPAMTVALRPSPSQIDLVDYEYVGGCGAEDVVRSDGTRSYDKGRTFFLSDVEEGLRPGSRDSEDWTTYFHAYPNDRGGITIQYWRFYAFNDALNDHGGDWEGFHVVLGTALEPERLRLIGHTDIEDLPPSAFVFEGSHPRVYSEGGGHATRASGEGIDARGCDDGVSCVLDPEDPRTFVRQETAPGGEVRWPDGAITPPGRLINLGSKTAPLHGQSFLQYSGLWGSPGDFYSTSGYWGPAYNETGMASSGFVTAWCAGIVTTEESEECYAAAISR
jgi:hypothetical protein